MNRLSRPRRFWRGALLCGAALTASVLTASVAHADNFGAGSYIVPMDTDYQDMGMFRAYGLVYELLRNNVPVRWAIAPNKAYGGPDFFADSVDYASMTVLGPHGYRGGPFIIDSADATFAQSVIDDWLTAYPETTVHVASFAFTADIGKYLENAPRVAMFADGNQKIARGYLEAAGIPDSTLDTTWPDTSPDMLTVEGVSGLSMIDHGDGDLFDEDGDPIYCQFMSMHWGVGNAEDDPEVVAEVREFLTHPTHFFAECQAVNAFENLVPYGHFLTPNGFDIMPSPNNVDHHHHDSPFAQLDGMFEAVGGSEPAYALPAGDTYKAGDITMITAQGFGEGEWDVWMTGFLDGACPPQQETCGTVGKVSYLGGHKYEVKTPISANPDSQGTRLFLNSLFDSECATASGTPNVSVSKSAPASTTSPSVVFSIDYNNAGPTVALDAMIVDDLPAGSTFVSASNGGLHNAGTVSWSVGNLGVGESGTVTVTVTLDTFGSYDNDVDLMYLVGLSDKITTSNTTTTVYDADSDNDGVVDSLDICPNHHNPAQDLQTDIDSCGTCGNVCSANNGTPECSAGVCGIASCNAGFSDCNGLYADGCEYSDANFQTDVDHCGACNNACSVSNGSPDCSAGTCEVASCNAGFSDCNGSYADGCEFMDSNFDTDIDNCGACNNMCSVANGSPACATGTCGVDSCNAGFSDCNGSYADGCEFDDTLFQTDTANCGACNNACTVSNGSPDCAAGACGVASCNAGFSDCNGMYADGCEYNEANFDTDVANCGACNNACSVANGSPDCAAGTCEVASCNAGFSDCNGNYADGCEFDDTNFQTDTANCGACNNACSVTNGSPDCAAGTCEVASCNAGFSDCNGNYADGCEFDDANFQTDTANCGACNNTCSVTNGSPDCAAGTCEVAACNAGFSDCNGMYVDGCEYMDSNFDTDLANCGACNNACSVANGAPDCNAGTCGVASCVAGFSDCNGMYVDGCEYDETNFQNDVVNCGGCNTACTFANATPMCANAMCAMGACDAGFVDLDNDPTNGCEYGCAVVAATDTTCDGVDDDCNGIEDDGFVAGTCGVGTCVATETCVNGAVTCTPGTPGTEGPDGDVTCSDNDDNDCDGDTDAVDADCMPMGMGGAGGGAQTGGMDATGGAAAGGSASSGSASGGAATGGSSSSGSATGGGDTGSTGAGANGNGPDGPETESGCSCHAVGSPPSSATFPWLLAGLGLVISRRRAARR